MNLQGISSSYGISSVGSVSGSNTSSALTNASAAERRPPPPPSDLLSGLNEENMDSLSELIKTLTEKVQSGEMGRSEAFASLIQSLNQMAQANNSASSGGNNTGFTAGGTALAPPPPSSSSSDSSSGAQSDLSKQLAEFLALLLGKGSNSANGYNTDSLEGTAGFRSGSLLSVSA